MASLPFGPEWYQFQAPPRHCPIRRVVARRDDPSGESKPQETLECGHVIIAPKRPGTTRRCTHCEPLLPSGKGREILIDPIVAYEPGHPRKRGWIWVSDPEHRVPCLRPTKYILMNPEFYERWRKEKGHGR